MKVYKAKANPLACRLLGQVLAERGREDGGPRLCRLGFACSSWRLRWNPRPKRPRMGEAPKKREPGETTTNH